MTMREEIQKRIEKAVQRFFEESHLRPRKNNAWRKVKKGSVRIGLGESGRPSEIKASGRDRV